MQQSNDNKKFWLKVIGQLENTLSHAVINVGIVPVVPKFLSENELELASPSIYTQTKLLSAKLLVEEAINKICQRPMKVTYVVREQEKPTKTLGPLFEDQNQANAKPDNDALKKASLLPKYSFENYLVGSNNQLAYAVAIAVAEAPGKKYNPYFLYSGVGLGKTHLVQAIGQKILQNNPTANVVYTTSEAFMNQLIESIQSGKDKGKYTSHQFRKKYREADVLIIDDIQFIVGRESTQNEFFHTFNTLILEGKQVIVTSDRPPRDFVKLEDRITSRLGSGMIADIQKPDTDMREAILRKKREENNDEVPNEVLRLIAEKVDSNIRELEGAYTQVLTEATARKTKLTKEFAQSILEEKNVIRKEKAIHPSEIIKAVCKYYSVRPSDIKGPVRTKDIVIPRQVAMYLIHNATNVTLMTTGDYLGGRDHSTILHGAQKIEAEIIKDPKLRSDVDNIKKMCIL